MPISSGTPVNRSGSITLGGTAQELAAANTSRSYLFVMNIAGEDLWVNFGAVAVADQPSIRLYPGEAYENPPHWCPTGSVSIIGATTGSKFVAKEA